MPSMLNRLPPYSGMSESTTSTRAPSVDELTGEVAADEPEPAGDHHAAVAVELLVAASGRGRPGAHGSAESAGTPGTVGLRNSTGVLCRPRPSTTSCTHSFSTSMPVQKTRRKLKNCERPCAAVVVVHRHLDDAKAGVLDLAHHLETDDAGVALELHAIEDLAAHQAEVAVDVAHAQPEEKLHGVVVDAADDDPVQRIRPADLVASDDVGVRRQAAARAPRSPTGRTGRRRRCTRPASLVAEANPVRSAPP